MRLRDGTLLRCAATPLSIADQPIAPPVVRRRSFAPTRNEHRQMRNRWVAIAALVGTSLILATVLIYVAVVGVEKGQA